MSIVRWEPLAEMVGLRREMDRLFGDSFVNPYQTMGTMGEHMAIPLDVYQTADEVVVKACLPGVKPEDVDISISGDTLTIKGETSVEEEIKEEDYFCQEQKYGTFRRSVVLPTNLKTSDAEAAFDNGILVLTIPRAEEEKPKTIKIKAKETKKIEKAK
ncbi:MAG: Hsp20/alpha crystallin family protein [Dehalococcoidia bacterium]|nr:Hsp20/alpha crystallin family protein [Dehalococcoidia bacterium]